MSSKNQKKNPPIFRRLLFCTLSITIVSFLFLPSASQAGWFSSEADKKTAETSVTLETFPPDVEFPEDIKDSIRYDASKKELVFKGAMYNHQRGHLLTLSTDEAYQDAIEALFELSLPLRTSKYLERIKQGANDEMAHSNLGDIYKAHGLFDLAIKHYKEANRLKHDRHLDDLGDLYFEKGFYNEAIEYYKEAIRLHPDYYSVHRSLGLAYHLNGMLDLAIKHYKASITLANKHVDTLVDRTRFPGIVLLHVSTAHIGLGNAYYDKEMFDEAISEFQKQIRLYEKTVEQSHELFEAYSEDYAKTHYNLSLAYQRKGLYELAAKHAEQAVLLKPDLSQGHQILDDLYYLRRTDRSQGSPPNKSVNRWITPSPQTAPPSPPSTPPSQRVGGKVYHLSNSKVFHRPDCSAIQGKTNLGEFSSRGQAIKAGAIPCKSCNP